MNYRRSLPFVSGNFVPTCVVRKRIKTGNYVHLNNKEVSKVFLHSHFLISTCAKSDLLSYGTFTLIYAKHFWDRTYRNIILSDNRLESFWMNSPGLQTFFNVQSTRFHEPKDNSAFLKCDEYKPNINCSIVVCSMRGPQLTANWNCGERCTSCCRLKRSERRVAPAEVMCVWKYNEMWRCVVGWWLPTFQSLCLHLQEQVFKDKRFRPLDLED